MKKTIALCLFAGVFVWLRVVLNSTAIETTYVGVIGLIAFIYVVMEILFQIRMQRIKRMESTRLPAKTKAERVKFMNVWIAVIMLIVIGLGIAYVCNWISSMGNDIISILALLLSLLSDEICAFFICK